MLLKYARKIEQLETAALAGLSQLAGEQRGDLRIGASLTIAQYILPRVLGAFQQQHPLVRPYVITCNTEQVLEAYEAAFTPFVGWRRDQDNLIFEENLGSHIPPQGRAFDESKRYFARHQRVVCASLLAHALLGDTDRQNGACRFQNDAKSWAGSEVPGEV